MYINLKNFILLSLRHVKRHKDLLTLPSFPQHYISEILPS